MDCPGSFGAGHKNKNSGQRNLPAVFFAKELLLLDIVQNGFSAFFIFLLCDQAFVIE